MKRRPASDLTMLWFNNRQRLFIISATAACQLHFNDRLVYSLLIWQASNMTGGTLGNISRVTTMDWRTVRFAVDRLIAHDLAEWRDDKLYAREPSGDVAGWFATRSTNADHWWDRLAYFPVCLRRPDAPLSTRTSALLFLLYSLARGRRTATNQSSKGLGNMLSISPRTVTRSLKQLRDAELIEIFPSMIRKDRFSVGLAKPTDKHRAWFQANHMPAGDEFPGLAIFEAAQAHEEPSGDNKPSCHKQVPSGNNGKAVASPIVDETHPRSMECQMMRSHGYSEDRITAILSLLDAGHGNGIDLSFFTKFLDNAERNHRTNQTRGKYLNVPDSSRLLEDSIRKWSAKQQSFIDQSLESYQQQERQEVQRQREAKARDAERKADQPKFVDRVRQGAGYMAEWKGKYGRDRCLEVLDRLPAFPAREEAGKRMSPVEFERLLCDPVPDDVELCCNGHG